MISKAKITGKYFNRDLGTSASQQIEYQLWLSDSRGLRCNIPIFLTGMSSVTVSFPFQICLPMSERRETAIVTGAARGIGFAIARKLASRKTNVLLADIQENLCKNSAAKLAEEFGVDAVPFKADVTKEEDIIDMVDFATKRWGRLDWACNNAGVGELLEDNEDNVTSAQFDMYVRLSPQSQSSSSITSEADLFL
jgi:hypothetical protein